MEPLISDATMAELEALDLSAMPSSCQILRRTNDQDPNSGLVTGTSYAPSGAPFSCRVVTSPGAIASIVGERLEPNTSAVISVPLGTDLTADDQIDVTTNVHGVDVTQRYAVVGSDPKPDSYSTSIPTPARLM